MTTTPSISEHPKPALFQPTRVGALQLQHRVVLAPLTRFRAQPDGTPSAHAPTYYAQRAAVPGTLLVAEGTLVAPRAGGGPVLLCVGAGGAEKTRHKRVAASPGSACAFCRRRKIACGGPVPNDGARRCG